MFNHTELQSGDQDSSQKKNIQGLTDGAQPGQVLFDSTEEDGEKDEDNHARCFIYYLK